MTIPTVILNESTAVPEEKYMFGSKEKQQLFREVKQTIVDQKILRLYQKEALEDESIQITICNFIRLIKHPEQTTVSFQKYNSKSKTWSEPSSNGMPLDIKLLPINKFNAGEDAWRSIIRQVIRWIMIDHGAMFNWGADGEFPMEKLHTVICRKYLGAYHVGSRRNRKKGTPRKPDFFVDGMLNVPQWNMASRALIKNIWTELIDKSFIGKFVSMKGFYADVTLKDYIHYSFYADSLARHYQERPNLVPLLKAIPPSEWKRPDLFSKKSWVKGERKTTVVDRFKQCELESFNSTTHYNWVFSRSNIVIRDIFRYNYLNAAKFLADIKIQKDLPAILYVSLMRIVDQSTFYLGSKEQREYFIKSYLRGALEVKKEKGYNGLKAHLRNNYEAVHVFDWLHGEGINQGFPRKNSTWASLVERSTAWHTHMRKLEKGENLTWDSHTPIIDESLYAVQPLTSTYELIDEGQKQSHCVGSYDNHCFKGHFRIFSITDLKNEKCYTLCLEKNNNTKSETKRWTVQQVRGRFNVDPPQKIQSLSNKIAKMYGGLEKGNLSKTAQVSQTTQVDAAY